LDQNKDKTARLAVLDPSDFVAERRRVFVSPFRAARSRSDLTEREVSFCAEILTFARTYFEENH
jgi:hypothetical protein